MNHHINTIFVEMIDDLIYLKIATYFKNKQNNNLSKKVSLK